MVMAAREAARCRPAWEPQAGPLQGLEAVRYPGACSTESSAGLRGYLCFLADPLWSLAGFRDRVVAELYHLAFSRESPVQFRGQLAAGLCPVV